MTKELKATRQTIGERLIKETKIIVPEHAYEVLKDFDIEIMDNEKDCSIYLVKDKEDKHSVTFKPHNNNSYVSAIKELIEKVEKEKEG